MKDLQSAFDFSGDKFSDLPVLNEEDMRTLDLVRKIRESDDIEAQNELILNNMGLINSLAKRYVSQSVRIEDLVQEGIFGLIRAAKYKKFDPKRAKFITFAGSVIKRSMIESIYVDKLVFQPTRGRGIMNKVKKASRKLTSELGRSPSPGEVAEFMGISEKKVLKILSQEEMNFDSIEAPYQNEESKSLKYSIADDGDDPEEITSQRLEFEMGLPLLRGL